MVVISSYGLSKFVIVSKWLTIASTTSAAFLVESDSNDVVNLVHFLSSLCCLIVILLLYNNSITIKFEIQLIYYRLNTSAAQLLSAVFSNNVSSRVSYRAPTAAATVSNDGELEGRIFQYDLSLSVSTRWMT